VTGSRYVHFWDRQKPCPTVNVATADAADGEFGVRRGPGPKLGDAGKGFGYAVQLTETFDGSPAGRKLNREAVAGHALKRVLPWEHVLRGHSPDECADLVQREAGLPLSVLHYCWQSHPEYLSETTKNRMVDKTYGFPAKKPAPAGGGSGSYAPPAAAPHYADPVFGDGAADDDGEPEPDAAELDKAAVAPPADAAGLYDADRMRAAAEKLRAEMNAQAQALASAAALPKPPQFRNKPGT
jgi:hypothetical protein